MRPIHIIAVAAVLAACGSGAISAQNAGAPLETRAANKTDAVRAFPEQTRAPAVLSAVQPKTATYASGLANPWGLAFMPDGRLLVTEKAGRLRIVSANGTVSPEVGGVPTVIAAGQGGLLDVAIDPRFAENKLIYLSYAEAGPDNTNGTAVGRGRLVEDAQGARLVDFQRIFQQQPKITGTNNHWGSRLVFAPDGKLFITLGDRSIMAGRVQSQDLNSHIGKIIRINADGTVPSDNPFVGRAGAKPEIWSYGHRNAQGAAIDPATGVLWNTEHGARGGDELNRAEKGKDYGWPTITYGLEYSGQPIGRGITQQAGMEQPVYYWDPVIAPGGMAFYNGAMFPAWRGNILVGSMGRSGGGMDQALVRLVLSGGKVVGEERIDLKERVRDIEIGPDGAIYIAADNATGRILKLTP